MVQKDKAFFEIQPAERKFMDIKVEEFDKLISEIKLNEEETDNVLLESVAGTIKDGVLESNAIGRFVKKLLDFSDDVNDRMNDIKKRKFLMYLFQKANQQGWDIKRIKQLLTDPFGNALFQLTLKLTSDKPPNDNLLEALSSVLIEIIEKGNFEELFEKNMYIIELVARLPHQAPILLFEMAKFPAFEIGNNTHRGDLIISDWSQMFGDHFIHAKNIRKPEVENGIRHCIKTIHDNRLVKARFVGDDKKMVKLEYSSMGEELMVFLKLFGR